jgi:hypothetical protein
MLTEGSINADVKQSVGSKAPVKTKATLREVIFFLQNKSSISWGERINGIILIPFSWSLAGAFIGKKTLPTR